MNRELPDEKILYGARSWQNVIIQICVGSPKRKGGWLNWTSVTHQVGGKVQVQEHSAPPHGWHEHWRRYREQHPELEPYWSDRAAYMVLP